MIETYQEFASALQHQMLVQGLGYNDEHRRDMASSLASTFVSDDAIHEDGTIRQDAVFTALDLEHMKPRIREVIYQQTKARLFLPVNQEANPGAEAIADIVMDERGKAAVLANMADDIPYVDIETTKGSKGVVTVASAYKWSILDGWRAAASKRPVNLQEKKGRACRRAIGRTLDEMGALGVTQGGVTVFTGLLNNADVTVDAPTTGTWTTAATPEQILADLLGMVNETVSATNEELPPDSMILPLAQKLHISSTQMSTDNSRTILQAFLESNGYVSNVESWTRAATAGAGGTTRAVVYRRDSEVLEWDIPLDFTQLPPERRSLGWDVICLARVSGVSIYHPSAVRYYDGLG